MPAIAGVVCLTGLAAAQTGPTLYQENFESYNAGSGFKGKSDARIQAGGGFNGTKGVRAEYDIYRSPNSSSAGSNRIVSNIDFANTAYDAVTLSYKIKYDADFTTGLGGKYFGVGPTDFITGGKATQASGWSARVVTDDRIPRLYLYDQDKENEFGRGVNPTNAEDRVPLEPDIWHDIQLSVQLNSTANSNDGFARLYVNGKQTAEFAGARFRGVVGNDTLPNTFLFHTFLGSGPYDQTGTFLSTQHVNFDDISITAGVVAVPEPAVATLVGVGMLMGLRRRRVG